MFIYCRYENGPYIHLPFISDKEAEIEFWVT